MQRCLPPVLDDQFGDEDGDLALGVVFLQLENVIEQRREHKAIG